MKHALTRWLAIWLLGLVAAQAAPGDTRFSLTLNAEDRAASGLTKLSSDEIAVIDALVRRDTTTRVGSTTDETVSALFSQRLTADEQRTAGLSKLSETELPKLNAFVDRFQSAKLARTLLAPPVYLARASRVRPTETRKEREIHGSFSLSYGMGSGGYSEKTGSMMLTMEDPDRGFSISVGYSQSHIKGGSVYRDPFYDPFPGRYDPFYGRNDPFYGRGDMLSDRYDPIYDPLRRIPEGPLLTPRP